MLLRLVSLAPALLFMLFAPLPSEVGRTAQAAKADLNWETIAGGVAYARGAVARNVPVHFLKIDLNRAVLKPLMAPRFSSSSRVKDFAARFPDALAIFNSCFFDESDQGEEIPKGIVVSDGKIHHGLLRSRPWSVFFIGRQGAGITSPEAYRHSGNIQFALQGFPRLIERGRVLKFKAQSSQRTALGIQGPRTLLILVTRDGASLSLQDLAQSLRDRGCQAALNLDGGSSTQLWLKKPGNPPLIEPGFNRIPVAVGVFSAPLTSSYPVPAPRR